MVLFAMQEFDFSHNIITIGLFHQILPSAFL